MTHFIPRRHRVHLRLISHCSKGSSKLLFFLSLKVQIWLLLWHSDIHASNILVSKGRITSLIDWQAAWTGQLFIEVQQPRPLDHRGEILLKLPEKFKELEVDKQNHLNKQVLTSILCMFMRRILRRRTRFLAGYIGSNMGEHGPGPFSLPVTPGKTIFCPWEIPLFEWRGEFNWHQLFPLYQAGKF